MRSNTSLMLPVSTASPEYITVMRSQVSRISPRLCDTKIIDVPSSLPSPFTSWTMPASTVTSSAVVGSSSKSSAGFDSSAMAITMRCCWPPESWCG